MNPKAIPPSPVWLIERGQTEGQIPTMWYQTAPYPEQGRWFEDVNKATQFATMTKAEECARDKGLAFYRAVEHLWIAPSREAELLTWAVSRWRIEVEQRPLVNVHRRTLDDTWRQVIRFAGGDPDALVGPSHDELLASQTSIQPPLAAVGPREDGPNVPHRIWVFIDSRQGPQWALTRGEPPNFHVDHFVEYVRATPSVELQDDLSQRLRRIMGWFPAASENRKCIHDAADALTAQAAELSRLRAELSAINTDARERKA